MSLGQLVRRLRPSGWSGWPERAYQRERYQQRLSTVRTHLAESLDAAADGRVNVLSVCAGDGRDLIGVLQTHPRSNQVAAWLVELDPQSVALGVRHATSAGLADRLSFLNADATDYATYREIPAADVILVCGVWGHVPAAERASLVDAVACLGKPGATAIWTRGVSKGMQRLQEIQSHFAGPQWEEVRLSFTRDNKWAVATYRYVGPAMPRPERGRIFNFQRAAGQ